MSDVYEYNDDELVKRYYTEGDRFGEEDYRTGEKSIQEHAKKQQQGVVGRKREVEDQEGWGSLTAREAQQRAFSAAPLNDQPGMLGLGAQYDTPRYRKLQSEKARNQIIYEREQQNKELRKDLHRINKEARYRGDEFVGDADETALLEGLASPVDYLSAEEYNKLFIGPKNKRIENLGYYPRVRDERKERLEREQRAKNELLTTPYDAETSQDTNVLGMHVKSIKLGYDRTANILSAVDEDPENNAFRSMLEDRFITERMASNTDYRPEDMSKKQFKDSYKNYDEEFDKYYAQNLSIVKSQHASAMKALEYVNSGEPYMLNEDYNKAVKSFEMNSQVVKDYTSSMRAAEDAKAFGSKEKMEQYRRVDPNLAAKYANATPETKEGLDGVFKELIELRDKHGDLFEIDRDLYNQYRTDLINGEVDDERRAAFLKAMQAKAALSPKEKKEKKDKSTRDLLAMVEKASLSDKRKKEGLFAYAVPEDAEEYMTTSVSSDSRGRFEELMRQARSVGSDALYKRWEESLAARGMDSAKTAASFNYLPNESLKQYKQGGIITKDGPIYAHGGEVILPKGFEDGGTVGSPAAVALNQSVSIDTSNLESVLSNFINSVGTALEGKSVSVEKPEWAVPVAMPEDGVKVSIDVTEASSALSSAISAALDKPIKVDSSGVQAVGGEKMDKLGEALQNVQDRLTTVKTELEGKIEMLNSSPSTSIDIDRRVASLIDQRVSQMQEEAQQSKQVAYYSNSEVQRVKQELNYRIDELTQRLRQTMSFTGVNPRINI
jgi:hypothetical protein